MEYSIKEVAKIIGAEGNELHDDAITILFTDSRTVSLANKFAFFALKTKTNDGHKYIPNYCKASCFGTL